MFLDVLGEGGGVAGVVLSFSKRPGEKERFILAFVRFIVFWKFYFEFSV